MWECEWARKLLTEDIVVPTTYRYPTEEILTMSQSEVIDHIRSGAIFGAAEVDISVPVNLIETFDDFPPIFKNAEVNPDFEKQKQQQQPPNKI